MNALEFATKYHSGQFRRDGVTPYIEHPKAVAERFATKSFLWEIALLHDVLEDTPATIEDLSLFFSREVVIGVIALTHNKWEKYSDYIKRISESRPATIVKIQDIKHNLSGDPSPRQVKKYADALIILAEKYI